MEKEIQADLFEHLNKAKIKKKFRHSFRKLFPYGFVNIRLSYESIIFSMIIFLMLFVVIFSLGIERGRELNRNYLKQSGQTSENIIQLTPTSEDRAKQSSSAYAKTDKPQVNISQEKLIQEPQKINYTVQILTYRDKTLAEKQMQKLIKNKYEAFIISSGGFYQICVGKYSSRENAKKDLFTLKKIYKDCFIRNIP